MSKDRSGTWLSSDRRSPEAEALLLRSVLEWPRKGRIGFFLDRPMTLVLARLTLALLVSVTKTSDDSVEERQ